MSLSRVLGARRTSPYNDLWMRSIEAAGPLVGMSTAHCPAGRPLIAALAVQHNSAAIIHADDME